MHTKFSRETRNGGDQFEKLRCKLEGNINMNIKELWVGGFGWINLAQNDDYRWLF